MPLKHGSKRSFLHGIVYIISVFLTVLLTSLFKRSMPKVMSYIDEKISKQIISFFKINLHVEVMSFLLITFVVLIVIVFFILLSYH